MSKEMAEQVLNGASFEVGEMQAIASGLVEIVQQQREEIAELKEHCKNVRTNFFPPLDGEYWNPMQKLRGTYYAKDYKQSKKLAP